MKIKSYQTAAGETAEAFAASAPAPLLPAAPPTGDRLSTEVSELKRELESIRRTLTRSAFAPPQWLGTSPDLSNAYAALTASGVSPDLAREIVPYAESGARSPPEPPQAPFSRSPRCREGTVSQRALVAEMGSRFTVQPMLGRGETRPRIVALVGHPGAGKTTTLVRLAVNYGLASRRPGRICRLGAFSLSRSDVDTQLVLSSSMKSTNLTGVVDVFEIFRPQRLLFAKLDETGSFGPILDEAARTGKPLSFFTTGQRIPEDLEAASRSRPVEPILAGHCGRAQAAA
jgi:signal recognition particle GTPase